MCILQAAPLPVFSHVAFPSEAHQGTRPSCLPSVTGETWPFRLSVLFGVLSNLSSSCKRRQRTPFQRAFLQPSWEAEGGWGPPLLHSSGIKKSQQPWNLQKVGWYCMHEAIQTRCLHAFLPTLPYPHWSAPSLTGSFSFLYLEPFSTKAITGEGHTCAAMTYKRLQSARHRLAPSSKVAMLHSFSLGRLNLFQVVRKC